MNRCPKYTRAKEHAENDDTGEHALHGSVRAHRQQISALTRGSTMSPMSKTVGLRGDIHCEHIALAEVPGIRATQSEYS